MPRIKKGRQMAILKDLTELRAAVTTEEIPPPLEGFQKLEPPPLEGFGIAHKTLNAFPAYIRLDINTASNQFYTRFVFNKKFVDKHFKKPELQRFEIVQHNTAKNWFVLQRAVQTKGNKYTGALCFNTTEYLDAKKLEKGKHYPLHVVKKDGVLYLKLPPELVPLLA